MQPDLSIAHIVVTVDDVTETQFIAMIGTHVVGRVGVKTDGLVASMRQLFVTEEQRGNGIGTALVTACVKEAQAAGCVAIDLAVDRFNDRVLRFYSRFGFHICADHDPQQVWMAKHFSS